jgi:two-component system, cell cycle sensor histidine kinase and response regulator CckA
MYVPSDREEALAVGGSNITTSLSSMPVAGSERHRRAMWVAAALGWYALAMGLVAFAGWVFDVRRLTAWGGGISIQPNTALAAVAAGAGLVLLTQGRGRAVVPLGTLCALIGLATLFEHASGIHLGIDALLTFGRPWASTATVAPGRMGPPAATSLSLLGIGLLAARGGRGARQTAAALGLATVTISALSIIGYLFGANSLYAVAPLTAIALPTTTMIVAVALGLVTALPDSQPMRTLLEPSGAGLLARRALPLIIVVPLLLGLLRLHGQQAGWYDTGMGTALLVLALIVGMSAVLWWGMGAVSAHERALAAAEEQVRQFAKMEAIGRLAGGVAHDFNNQLNAVSGFATFAAKDPGLGDGARHDLQEILKATERMAGLTRQLLAFSRQQVLKPEPLQLNAAVLDGSSLLQRLIGTHIEFRLDLTADPTWIQVDRAQLLQVLMNLVINARDAMSLEGLLDIRTGRLEVTGRKPLGGFRDAVPSGSYVLLSVSDNGAGILPENLPHLFEPFFTTKEPGQGTGLGLATVHGIVTQSQGHIRVESRPGEGSKFTVLFPAVSAPPDLGAVVDGAQPGLTPRPARLLVVDDEDAVRAVLSRALEAEGYEVSQARNGREALERLAGLRGIDAVLTDVIMPELGGRELVERLAAEYPGLPVIWMSGYPRDAAVGDGGSAGTHPFLQKPISPDVLIRAVEDVLSRSHGLRRSGHRGPG